MNSAIASNINGGVVNNQQVASGSHSSLLLSSIEFSLSETKTNFSGQGKFLTVLSGKEVFNGGNKPKLCDLNKNLIGSIHPKEEAHLLTNGNAEKNSEDSIPVPKVQLYTGKIQVEWNHTHKIGAGLHNLGNTCFMNTVIQCLTYTPPLANYLLHDDHASKCTITGFCMMCLLQKHMKRAIGKTGEVIKPMDVYQRLRSIAKHFQFGRQEDAHEFLRYVIDHLWKSCLPQNNGVNKLDPASKETTVINKIFGGYHRSQVICMRCKKESNTFDHFMDFILDIKQNVMSLEKALEKYIQPELLQQENCYKCPKCKMKVEAQKRFSVYRAPTVATFQLKRFDYNRSFGGKITKQITYPEKLNLRPYMSENKGEPVWYLLNAVLVHSGASCNSGHYYCYVKNSNGFWYVMDDTRVQQVSLNSVLNQSAYVLFYIRVENTERPIFKKCLDNKSSFMKGSVSNSHFSKVSEMGTLKPNPFVDKISSYASPKSINSPNNIKKLNYSSPTREKISFGFRSSPMSASITPSKSRNTTNEAAPASHGGLVPYVEDSSESSDASESNPSPNSFSNGMNGESKQHAKSVSVKSNNVTPLSENKSLTSNLNLSPVCSVSSKVSTTSPWIVADALPAPSCSSSNSSGVNSTSNWHAIEASSLKSYDSMKVTPNKDFNNRDSPKLSMPILPTSATDLDHDNLSSAKKLPQLENGFSIQKCNFRKQLFKNKAIFSEDKETVSNAKRKYGDLYSKSSTDTVYEHSKNRLTPVSKKGKFDESLPLVVQENGVRNESSKVDTADRDNVVQKHFSVPDKDNYSRTSLVNGVSGHSDTPKVLNNQSSNLPNGTVEHNKNIPETDNWFTKGKHKNRFFTESSKSFQFEKGNFSDSNGGKNSSLYGTEVPTWKEENPFRPSIISEHENRRSFDDYDQEFDRGKVRKSKTKDRYQYFQRKNPFQKHADRYHGKYNNKFYNNYHNHRKYDSYHNWKSNHGNNYHNKYRNHHHRHY